MSTTDEQTVTITLPARNALVQHIEFLQAKLTERNAQIDRLKTRLEADGESPAIQKARAQGYTDGWKECANALIDTADSAARALGKVRRDAIEAYNEAYRRTEGAQS